MYLKVSLFQKTLYLIRRKDKIEGKQNKNYRKEMFFPLYCLICGKKRKYRLSEIAM